ncbi:MAG TPA: hypothetical protein VLH75_04595 [Longimicrobiales bacterium]|nr:hypothetical protein [Longimicrobiales bacterium]
MRVAAHKVLAGGACGARRLGRGLAALAASAAILVAAGCSLEEITLVEAEDVVVAEVYVQVGGGSGGTNRVTAWLHRTLAAGSPSSAPVPGAEVLVTSARGLTLELAETDKEICAYVRPREGTGTCYATTAEFAGEIFPGDFLELEIALPGGGLIRGSSRVPEGFLMLTPSAHATCRLEPLTPLELRWTASGGAWAYVGEALIRGLKEALAPQGIKVLDDPLYLQGLAVSAEDTTIVLPGEFGLFDRFDLDQGLAVALQRGLPAGTEAQVVITAGDRNYVNWLRGGNFNPSGVVKIPSLRGDGTGVFATSVSRRFQVVVPEAGGSTAAPPCVGG